jgi:hypothetical protein
LGKGAFGVPRSSLQVSGDGKHRDSWFLNGFPKKKQKKKKKKKKGAH